MYIYAHGTERGAIDLFRRDYRLPIIVRDASKAGDKFVRSMRTVSSWNDGRIRVPESADWLPAFLAEVESFTGVNDKHDDQVDALVALWDVLSSRSPWHVIGDVA